jgi:hypothetical protein
MPRTFQTIRFYNFATDSDAARISMFDDNGHEYFYVMDVPKSAKTWRAERARAVDAIGMAIDQGLTPGQVMIDE